MSAATTRLFFAAWPAAAERAAIAQAAAAPLAGVVGRAVPAAHWHVTLAFLGAVAATAVDGLLALGASLAGATWTLTLDRREWWSASGVLVLVASAPPAVAIALQGELRTRLDALGHRVDAHPWRAHLTLARGVTTPPAPCAPVALQWPVRTLALVASTPAAQGRHYAVLAAWPRAAANAGFTVI